jgi:superfamily I DNA/RNA helicase
MPTPEEELAAATEAVVASESTKRLVVAGPGAGKTFLFRRLLEEGDGDKDRRLVLTFINTLKNDLERNLGEMARVHTLHSYCQSLLYAHPTLRQGLSDHFICHPGLVSLIKSDWVWLNGTGAPQFVKRCES